MDVESKFRLVIRDVEEVVTEDELRKLIESGGGKGYLGFEPSGIFHIGWLVWAFKFRDLVEAGFDMCLLAATWHAWINDKLGGNMELIKASAKHVVDVLKLLGLEGRFKLIYAEELVKTSKYWGTLLKCAKEVSLARVKRALTIMGRIAEEAETDFSKLIYPLMQVTDIFELDVDLALGGLDQRKAHMLARDIAEKLGKKKVVAVHTPLIPSLQGPGRMDVGTLSKDERLAQVKMSKSKPETAIFIVDSDEEIRSKIRKAYCPPRKVEDNPVLSIARHIIFRGEEKEFVIERPARYGGPVTVWSYSELEKLYIDGKVHPLDLKNAVADYLIKLVAPIRERVSRSNEVRKILEFMHGQRE